MNTHNPIMAALLAEETVSEEFKATVAQGNMKMGNDDGKPQFTPGPWKPIIWLSENMRALTNEGQVPIVAPSEENDRHIAYVTMQVKAKRGEGYKATDPERDANAHLIAAAPDMYAALVAVLEAGADGNRDLWEKAMVKASFAVGKAGRKP